MSSDMDSRGIIFELQWRKKHGVVFREEDIASLGIWDTDPALDWVTFKSYLSQNLGTSEEISVAYVDSEGDELPIESECEFHEALKFARQQTHKGRNIVLKVDKKGLPSSPPADSGEVKRTWKPSMRGKRVLTSEKSASKDDKRQSHKPIYINTSELVELVQKNDKMMHEKLEQMAKIQEQQRKTKLEKDDYLSPMLKKYLQKMKNEIVSEVTTSMRLMLTNLVLSPPSHQIERRVESVAGTRSKKRISDEDSSDAALGSDQRDHKLLRKIEKLHKREKKLEKKLDSKLEKLENKTKRMMEKKSQGKLRSTECHREPEKKASRKRSGDGSVGPYLMDAILLNDGPKAETHIKLGKRFTKIWEIMNNGTLPWTDKTELRLAWGTLGLEPEEAVVKCPILEPGEKGQIAVNFRAPDFPGTFESYWHFYHMGERFGHWVGCAVVVEEPNKLAKSPPIGTEVYGQGALKKTYLNAEKEGHGNFEKLDNLEGAVAQVSDNRKVDKDPSPDQNLDNVEKASIAAKLDVAVDLSMKGNADNAGYAPPDAVRPNNNNINVDRQAFYVDGSDYDNLSLFSGVSDNDSDSDSDEFVMVPMPACFLRDVPLGSDSVPVFVKDEKKEAEVPGAAKEGPEAVKEVDGEYVSLPSSNGDEEEAAGVSTAETEGKTPSATASTYAVDAEGSCVPLSSAWPASPTTKIPLGYLVKQGPSPKRKQAAPTTNFKSSQTNSYGASRSQKFDSSSTDNSSSGPHHFSHSASFKCDGPFAQTHTAFSQTNPFPANPNFPQANRFTPRPNAVFNDPHFSQATGVSHPYPPFNTPEYWQAIRSCSHADGPFAHPHFPHANRTFPRAHRTYPNCQRSPPHFPVTYGQTQGTFTQAKYTQASGTAPQCHGSFGQANGTFEQPGARRSEEKSQTGQPADGPVHILPETIVNGAINVATSALNTARTVLSNFRSTPSPARSACSDEPPPPPPFPTVSMDEALQLLSDMGFVNRAANVQLLYRFDNDIAKVVSELVRGVSLGLDNDQ